MYEEALRGELWKRVLTYRETDYVMNEWLSTIKLTI